MKYGLYVHIPICEQKCGYCDFVSGPMDSGTRARYIEALEREIAQRCKGLEFDTVFVGGGNPGALECGELERVLGCVQKTLCHCERNKANCRIKPAAATRHPSKNLEGNDSKVEFTVELNPERVTEQKVKILAKHGVNRVSLGLQTHDEKILTKIGRRHGYNDFVKAVGLLRAGGINNINADVMLGLPDQSLENAQETIDRLINLDLPHISAYSLKVEKGTPLYESGYTVDTDVQAEMYDTVRKKLRTAGYGRYEISNFAKKGYECRHNLKYWKLQPYIGCGLAAHSMVDGKRIANTSNRNKYLSGQTIDEVETITPSQAQTEYIMLGLRLEEGIELNDLGRAQNLIDKGYLIIQNNRLKIAPDKFYIANAIIGELLL